MPKVKYAFLLRGKRKKLTRERVSLLGTKSKKGGKN
jgi:hypothetical protein